MIPKVTIKANTILKKLKGECQAYRRGRRSETVVVKAIFPQFLWSSSYSTGIKKQIQYAASCNLLQIAPAR